MSETYCRAEMKFIDVTAINDATVTTRDNQQYGDIGMFQSETAQADYGTLELNEFILDGSKTILPDAPGDIGFWSDAESKDDCTFDRNPKIAINFTEPHSSSGITLYFAEDYPAELVITWYTIGGAKLMAETFYPDALTYVCKKQVQNYGMLTVEFIRTRLPARYVKLQYILYGQYIAWDRDIVQTATVQEDIDVTSATLPINTAAISILDADNDFDAENESGAWRSVQKTQEVVLSEYKDGALHPVGAFYIDDFSFADNIANFTMIDAIGLTDKYTFYAGKVYDGERAGTILAAIFAACGITRYTVDEEVANMQLSGYLGIQTCRAAIQQVCFAAGAVADDSRSDTIKIYRPDRYVSATVGTDRKFNGDTKVTLDAYVSGVSIECNKYSLEAEETEAFKGILPSGRTTITFSEPYSEIRASRGTLVEVKTNYLVIDMPDSGECIITGRKYTGNAFSIQKNVENPDAGEPENVIAYSGITLYNSEYLNTLADKLLSYHVLRKKLDMRYLTDGEGVGDWVNIRSISGKMATTLVESQSIDLTGGYIAAAACRGYTTVLTEDIFAGTELYTGGDVII